MPLERTRAFGFGLVWVGQLVSLVGSGLTQFALGVWVYQQTGSVTRFSLIALSGALPGLLLAPLAGALVDRWDRRRVMLLADVAAGAGTLAAALLLRAGGLEVWHVYAVVATGSVARAFHWPAYVASTSLLLPKRHFGRASGLMQLGHAAAEMVAPVLAGLLMVTIGLQGVLLVDFATFLFAAACLLPVAIPSPSAPAGGRPGDGSLASEALYGWRFIRAYPGLLGLLLYFAMINFVYSLSSVLLVPLVLAFSTESVLGTVLSVSNAGLLVGGVAMSATGGPRQRIHGILGFGVLLGVALAAAGLRPYAPLIAAACFVMMAGAPVINGCSQAIWQSKVPPDVQGRVFTIRRVVAQFTAPLALLIAGPLAERVFEPLLAPGGGLAGSAGRILGTGPGRGIGLLYVLLAVLPVLGSLWGYRNPRIRWVESELPDLVEDPAPSGPVPKEAAAPG
jgi:MFS transporter, DHA3 family, macrolide efflux protein